MAEKKLYTIPLRDAWKVSFRKRSKKAMYLIRVFAEKHMKTDSVKIGPDLNHHIWEKGIKSPPRKVKVQIVPNITDKAEVIWVELAESSMDFLKKREEDKKAKKQKEMEKQKAEKEKAEKEAAAETKEGTEKETKELAAKKKEEKKEVKEEKAEKKEAGKEDKPEKEKKPEEQEKKLPKAETEKEKEKPKTGQKTLPLTENRQPKAAEKKPAEK